MQPQIINFLRVLVFLLFLVSVPVSIMFWVVSIVYSPAFIVDLNIRNDTGKTIEITPLGFGERGQIRSLPIFDNLTGFFSLPDVVDLKLDPGESVTLNYDWDDVNFNHILVRGDGLMKRATFSWSEMNGCCSPRALDMYVLDGQNYLEPTDADMNFYVSHSFRYQWIIYNLILLAPLLLITLYFFMLKINIRDDLDTAIGH